MTLRGASKESYDFKWLSSKKKPTASKNPQEQEIRHFGKASYILSLIAVAGIIFSLLFASTTLIGFLFLLLSFVFAIVTIRKANSDPRYVSELQYVSKALLVDSILLAFLVLLYLFVFVIIA